MHTFIGFVSRYIVAPHITLALATGLSAALAASSSAAAGAISGGGPVPPGVVARAERLISNDPVVRDSCLEGNARAELIEAVTVEADAQCRDRGFAGALLPNGVYTLVEDTVPVSHMATCVGYAPAFCQ